MPLPATRPLREQQVFALLRAGVPLSLLIDLAQPDPRSTEIYQLESCRRAS